MTTVRERQHSPAVDLAATGRVKRRLRPRTTSLFMSAAPSALPQILIKGAVDIRAGEILAGRQGQDHGGGTTAQT
eukprot:g9310.t1